MNVAELYERNVERFGERVAVVHEGSTHTNVELRGRAARLGNHLRELGVAPGDRVAVGLSNCPDVGVAYEAISRMGAICVPLLVLLAAGELRRVCVDAAPVVVVTDQRQRAWVANAVKGLAARPRLLVLGSAETEEALAAASDGAPVVPRAAEDLAVLAYTSGSTGKPKGVQLTHGNLLAQVDLVGQVLSYRPEDVVLSVLPMAHVFGLAAELMAQHFGYCTVVHRWFTPDAFLRDVPQHRVTSAALVPTMLTMVLAHPAFPAADLSSLDTVVVGASPLPDDLADAWEERTGSRILQGYGLTETAGGAAVDRPGMSRRRGACGLPLPGTEATIVDERLRPLPPGRRGEICLRGPQVTPGYWNDPEATEAALAGDWLRTGDVGYLDHDGYLYVTERMKDLVISSGLNVHPRDVEEVLCRHPAVAEAAVIGMPDREVGEAVVACIVRHADAEVGQEELMRHCAEHLAVHARPRSVHFLEALPRSPIGKIVKRELRDLLRDR
jgi:long-chain acyl-CoA synthetase